MGRSSVVNTFNKMMGQDTSSHFTSNETYRYARNGRIRFNGDGLIEVDTNATLGGQSGAFSNERGTKKIGSLCPGYLYVGSADLGNYLIILSTNDKYSEVGRIYIDDDFNASDYETLYNDEFDPHKELLGFKKDIFLQTSVSVENPEKQLIYWRAQGVELGVFNYNLSIDEKTGKRFHKNQCGQNTYPRWLCAHGMNRQLSVEFSRLTYVKTHEGKLATIDGPVPLSLKSGLFQYTYSYETKDGQVSPWYPLPQGINLSSSYYVDPSTGKAIENHHKYNMYETGIQTQKGIEIAINRVDIRYHYIRFAFVYSKTKDLPHEFAIFERKDISGVVQGSGISVIHRSHQGESVDFAELNATKDYIKSAKTGKIHNAKMFEGGIKLRKPPIIDTKNIVIKPVFKQMVCDETGVPLFKDKQDVLTNTTPSSHSVWTLSYTDKFGQPIAQAYPTINEYANYKGSRWEHLFSSYWRNETYPFAIVVGDIKGYPFYAQHIKDYKFPAQTDNKNGTGIEASLSLDSGKIRIMGAYFSGIELPESVLFDEKGNLQVGYFAIVRSESAKRIIHQGVLMNTVFSPACDEDDEGGKAVKDIIRAQPYLPNHYRTGTDGQPPSPANAHTYDPAKPYPTIGGTPLLNGKAGNCDGDAVSYRNAPGIFLYHSPDVRVKGSMPDLSPTDYLELTGTMHSPTNAVVSLLGSQLHFYTKAYLSDYTTKRVDLDSKTRMFNSLIVSSGVASKDITIEKFDLSNLKREFHAYTDVLEDTGVRFSSLVAPSTGLVVSKDWSAIDVSKSDKDALYYHTVNYCKQTDEYFTKEGESSFANRRYFSTNHFQEINREVLERVPKVNRDGETMYVFNNIEVWGGDCYPHLFDTTINYPNFSEGCDGNAGFELGGVFFKGHKDLAMSIIVPIESHYNMMMKYGRSFAENGTQSESCGCDGILDHQQNGISQYQPEDWNVNDILQHQERLVLYPGLPSQYNFIHDIPNRWVYSVLKTDGQRKDAYRSFLPLNYYDVEGEYGAITGCAVAFEYLFSFQERAYGALQVNQKAAVSVGSGLELIMGTGKDLSGIDYISRTTGCQHRDSIYSTGKQVLWVDARNGAIRRHSQAGGDNITDMYGLHDFGIAKFWAFENNDNSLIRIVASEGVINSDVIFSFVFGENSESVAFNTDRSAFHYFMDYGPNIFLRHKKFLLSPSIENPGDLLIFGKGKYGEYDGKLRDTILSFVVNEGFATEKVFDFVKIMCTNTSWDLIYKAVFRTQEQEHIIDLTTDKRVAYKHDILSFPIFQLEGMENNSRARGRVMQVELFIKNDGIRKIDIQAVETSVRQSFKR